MPKKGGKGKPTPGAKGKGGEGGAGKPSGLEPLPQVWLPNQPDMGSLDDTDLPPPSQKEQEQVAMFWAMEEANSPRGWDEEQELDYAEASRRRGERTDREVASGNPDLFKYAQSSAFTVGYLGCLTNVEGLRRADKRGGTDSQADVLENIDRAQRQGRLPWVTSEQDQRVLSISKYGIKVTDVKRQRVYCRHALHAIANITYYEDTYGKHMIAVKLGRPGVSEFDLYMYQCAEESQAKDICLTLAQAFEAVFQKTQLQQNLHTSDLQ